MYRYLFKYAFFPLYESVLRSRPTLRLLAQLERQQWFDRERIEAIQWEKLKRLLGHAFEQVPYYRERWSAAGIHPEDVQSPEDVARIPVLTKEDVRSHFDHLQAENYRERNTIRSRSSGSTGEPVSFVYPRESEAWRVAGAARSDRWAGWDWGRKEAYVWGVSLVPESRLASWKKRLHHALLRRRTFSSFDLSAAALPHIARRLRRFCPEVVIGYTNALDVLALFILESGLRPKPPRGVIASAEMLYDYQRKAIEEAFRCPVFNRYGCREMRLIAGECERHNGLHLNADNVYTEFVRDDGDACAPGEAGDVLVTDLNNYGMPLIRYQIGDRGIPSDRTCECGRGLPLMEGVTGRTVDTICLPDGRRLDGHFFTHLFLMNDFPSVKSFQFEQTAVDNLVLRIVRGPGWTDDTRRAVASTLVRHVGHSMQLSFEFLDRMPLTSGGKWRVVIGLPEERSLRP